MGDGSLCLRLLPDKSSFSFSQLKEALRICKGKKSHKQEVNKCEISRSADVFCKMLNSLSPQQHYNECETLQIWVVWVTDAFSFVTLLCGSWFVKFYFHLISVKTAVKSKLPNVRPLLWTQPLPHPLLIYHIVSVFSNCNFKYENEFAVNKETQICSFLSFDLKENVFF